MSFAIRVPASIFPGWKLEMGRFSVGLLYHSLQCDQVWIFFARWERPKGKDDIRFGYRTRGDATPKIVTYQDGGWHWPWKYRFTCGRY
jgi:hypothetical protein